MRALGVLGLLLMAHASSGAAQQVVRLRVIDAGSDLPVAGAMVRVRGTALRAITDDSGKVRIEVGKGERINLRIERMGYTPAQRSLDAGRSDPVLVLLEPAATPLDAVVVTASRRSQRLVDAPVAIEVVSQREIQESGAADIAAVLFEKTGIELEGGHPAGAGAQMQGFGSERVLILLDGQPLPGRIAGSFDLSRIPVSMIERVEIVKGPQSTLFGSDAMGGVINLITHRPSGRWQATTELGAGSAGRLNGSTQLQGKLLGTALLASGGRRTIEVMPGQGETEGARSERWDALLESSWKRGALDLEASALLVDERQRWQSGQLFNFADNRQVAIRASAGWQLGDHRLSPTLYLSEFEHLSRRANGPVAHAGGELETQRITEAELLYSVPFGNHAIDAGVELRREAIESPRVVGAERSLNGAEAFTQFTMALGRMNLVPGVRFSNTAAWGTHWTPRLLLAYRPVESVALRASVGKAFRAPAFKELYMRFANLAPGVSYVVHGNADLRPETSSNASLGVELGAGRSYLRAQAFHNWFDDFIETRALGDSGSITVFGYDNIQNGTTRGGEVEVATAWRQARLELGYSYLEARDDATNQPLLGRPAHTGRAQLGYTTPLGARVSLTAVHTGRAPVMRTEAGTQYRDAYTRIDARTARTVGGGFDLAFGVDNILQQRPSGWPGFTGRQYYASVLWRVNGSKETRQQP